MSTHSIDVSTLSADLRAWFAENQRDLPWRRTRDPYAIWVSEVMLQQTQVVKVRDYYHRFLDRFPTIEDLATADTQAVLKLWEGLGYYSRARNLHKAARQVSREQGGVVPQTYAEFRALPGVGDYIAAAVLSIAFDQPYPVVDGNVKRVLARLFMLEAPVNKAGAKKVFQRYIQQIFDENHPNAFNQAMMELGALICRPRNPDCANCPLSTYCLAFQEDAQDAYPQRVKRKKVPTHPIAVGVVYQGNQVLITRRQMDGLLGGLWEFPGGKINTDETASAACQREIREETNLKVDIVRKLATVKHAYTHFKIELAVFLCQYKSGEVVLDGPIDHAWMPIDQLAIYPFPKANLKFIPHLKPTLADYPTDASQNTTS